MLLNTPGCPRNGAGGESGDREWKSPVFLEPPPSLLSMCGWVVATTGGGGLVVAAWWWWSWLFVVQVMFEKLLMEMEKVEVSYEC